MSELIMCLLIGFCGGLLGGFLGIGGSLVFIPALSIFLDGDSDKQHLFQAAAMGVNLFVALAAVVKHIRAKVVRADAVMRMAPAALIMIFVGVWTSNHFEGAVLARIFAIFLVYVIGMNLRKIVKQIGKMKLEKQEARAAVLNGEANSTNSDTAGTSSNNGSNPRRGNVTTPRGLFVGSVMGYMAGLLGIGGGGIAVPLQQVVYRTPLRQCIGTSTAVICITAGFGAIYKNYSLHTLVDGKFTFVDDSLPLIMAIVPTAIVGAYIGATLTHYIPTLYLRIAFVVLLFFAALKMFGWL